MLFCLFKSALWRSRILITNKVFKSLLSSEILVRREKKKAISFAITKINFEIIVNKNI